ncbi:MAG: hypothetical protein NTW87_02960, partial [Planctomycetota bacterium]|nr:hypothetical protein [Planctomycetota bacterium]
LLGVLGRVGGKNSLEALRAGLKDKDEKVVDASLRAMAKSWPDAACLDDLLNMAKTAATDVHKIVALQGYVRVAGLPSGRSAADTLKLYQAAMEVAKRPEERKSVLAGLGDVKSAAALEIVAGCLADEAVKGEAEAAAVKIAKEIWQQQMAAVEPVMTKVVEGTKNNNVKKDARDVLNQIAKKKKK